MLHISLRVALVAFVLVSACEDKKEEAKARSSSGNPSGGANGPLDAALVGVIALPEDAPPGTTGKGASVAVEGRPDVAVTADDNGNFVFLPGQLAVSNGAELIGSAQSLKLIVTHTVGTDRYALRQEDVVVVEGNKTDLGKVAVKWAGSITGQVRRYGQTDHAGIDVYIPGTSLIAKTDEGGNFSLPVVPEGRWRLRFETAGFVKHIADDVAVIARRNTVMPLLDLGLDTGPAGQILPINGGKLLGSQSADVPISFSSNATLMLLSEDKAFAGATWVPASRIARFTFGGSGLRTLYAKFADANGQESPPVSGTVDIDVAPPDQGAVTIDGGAPYTNQRAVTLAISGNDAAGIVEMQISEAPAFEGAKWTPYAASAAWTLSEGDGAKTVYVRLKDAFGYVTPYRISNAITLDTAGATPVAFTVAQGSIVKERGVTLNVSATDGGSGLKRIKIGESSSLAGATSVAYATNVSYELSAGDGTKTIYLAVEDEAGNQSAITSAVVTLDQTAPGAATLSATVQDKGCADSDGYASRMKIALTWSRPSDATEVWILRKNDSYPTSPTDGLLVVAATSGTTYTESHTTLARLTAHYYRAFAKDAAGNFSNGATAVAVPRTELGCRTYPLTTNRDASGAYTASSGDEGWSLSAFGPNFAVATAPNVPNQLHVFQTANGGATWTRTRAPASEHIKSVRFGSETKVYLYAQSKFDTSTNSGATWNGFGANVLGGTTTAVEWTSANKGYAIGFGDEFYFTADGGASWSFADCSAGGTTFEKIVAIDGGTAGNFDDTLWITAHNGSAAALYKVTGIDASPVCTSIGITAHATSIKVLAAFDANTAMISCATCGPSSSRGIERVIGVTPTAYGVADTLVSGFDFVAASFSDANTVFFQITNSNEMALYKVSSFGTTPTIARQMVQGPADGETYHNSIKPKDIRFATPTRGYMLFAEGTYGTGVSLLSTDNGGASWTYAEATTRVSLRDVVAFDANTAVAVGGNATVATTTDGGANWTARIHAVGPMATSMRAVSFAPGSQTGFAVGTNRGAMKTTDRGQTWTGVTISGAAATTLLEDVAAATTSLVVAVGDGSNPGSSTSRAIWVSTDGGSTWADRSSVGGPVGLRAVSFGTATEGVAVGDAGAMLKTVDGGATWFALSDRYSANFVDVHFIDGRTGWISGYDGLVLKTTDGGASWVEQPFQATAILKRITFLDEKIGWVVAHVRDSGLVQTIYATTNGGANWFKVEVPATVEGNDNVISGIGGVKVGNAYHLFAAGSYGNIHKITLTP